MVLKKDAKSRLELELLERSLDLDKFKYDSTLRSMLVLYGGLIAILATALGTRQWGIVWGLIIGLMILPPLFFFLTLGNLKKRIAEKWNMVLSKYHKLGLNIREMNLELTNSKGSHK